MASYGLQEEARPVTTTSKSARMGSRDPEIDPLRSPDAWWSAGVRYAFDWLRECFLERLSSSANALLRDAGLTFFRWRDYDDRVTLDASSCSLALMLKPWLPVEGALTMRTDGASHEEPSGASPVGIAARREEATNEARMLQQSLRQLLAGLESDARKHEKSNIPLAEVLRGAANAMRTLVTVADKERDSTLALYLETMRHSVVAARAMALTQKWLYDRARERLKRRVDLYARYRDSVDGEFMRPSLRTQEQQSRFRLLWSEVRDAYARFLRQQGLEDVDPAATEALEVTAAGMQEEDFTPSTVNLLRQYIHHMKRLAHANVMTTSATAEGNFADGAARDANPVRRLYVLLEKKKRELSDLNEDLTRTTDLLRQGGLTSEQRQSLEERAADLQTRRREIARLAENSVRVLRRYVEYPQDGHNRWLQMLDRLETNLEGASREWSRVRAAKERRRVQLEEEVKSSLESLEKNVYRAYDRDAQRLLGRWNAKQRLLEKRREQDAKQLAMEKYVANEWLSTFERKLVYFGGEAVYPRKIGEFRSLFSMASGAQEAVDRIDRFEQAYRHLLPLWRLVFAVCHSPDLSPGE